MHLEKNNTKKSIRKINSDSCGDKKKKKKVEVIGNDKLFRKKHGDKMVKSSSN